jgi:hypothetical protein
VSVQVFVLGKVLAEGSTSAQVRAVEAQWALGSALVWVLGLAMVAVLVLGWAQERAQEQG